MKIWCPQSYGIGRNWRSPIFATVTNGDLLADTKTYGEAVSNFSRVTPLIDSEFRCNQRALFTREPLLKSQRSVSRPVLPGSQDINRRCSNESCCFPLPALCDFQDYWNSNWNHHFWNQNDFEFVILSVSFRVSTRCYLAERNFVVLIVKIDRKHSNRLFIASNSKGHPAAHPAVDGAPQSSALCADWRSCFARALSGNAWQVHASCEIEPSLACVQFEWLNIDLANLNEAQSQWAQLKTHYRCIRNASEGILTAS